MSPESNSASNSSIRLLMLTAVAAIALYLVYNYFTTSDRVSTGVDAPIPALAFSGSQLADNPQSLDGEAKPFAPAAAALGDMSRNAMNNFSAEGTQGRREGAGAKPTTAPGDSSANLDEFSHPNELSSKVMRVIAEVQSRQLDGQWEEALNEMNALYADFDSLRPFEQVTLLNFYTNTLIRLEMWNESISAFSRILTIPELRPDLNARALLALGQLHSRTGDKQQAQGFYHEWLAFTEGKPGFEQQTPRVQLQLAALQTK